MKPPRNHFSADWAFGVRGAIENIVRTAYPALVRQWPTLQSFNFEAYYVESGHFVIALRDKISGVPSGPGDMKELPFSDHPAVPPTPENIAEWIDYLVGKLSLRTEDVALVLPIHDSGRNDAAADYDMFSPLEKQLWDHQLRTAIARQRTALQAAAADTPRPPHHITYNISGTNSRVNINSNDSSVNVVSGTTPVLFDRMLDAIRATSASDESVKAVGSAIEEMAHSYGTESFSDKYTKFMGVLADHIQVFGPAIAPFLPDLAQLVA